VAVVLSWLLASCGASGSGAAPHPTFGRSATGLPVAPYDPAAFGFSSADAAWLVANGSRVVRLGVLASGLMPSPGTSDQADIDHLAATVNLLASHGILTLLDVHQDGWDPPSARTVSPRG